MPDLYFLVEFPIFRDFDGDDVEALGGACELQELAPGEAVCREGDPGDAMYIVKSGVLEVSRKVAGRDVHINLFSAGEFFGEMALIDGSPRSADVTVREASVLVKLPAEAYRRLKSQSPASALKLADVLLKQLSYRVRRTTTRALASETAGAAPAAGSGKAAKGTAKPRPKARPKAAKAAARRKAVPRKRRGS
jgi:CRP-like cAMP-binding protein